MEAVLYFVAFILLFRYFWLGALAFLLLFTTCHPAHVDQKALTTIDGPEVPKKDIRSDYAPILQDSGTLIDVHASKLVTLRLSRYAKPDGKTEWPRGTVIEVKNSGTRPMIVESDDAPLIWLPSDSNERRILFPNAIAALAWGGDKWYLGGTKGVQ
jgi:hypothetical protein